MTFYIEFLNRDFTERASYPWRKVELESLSKSAIGGPKNASLRIEGSADSLWELAEMMRAPVNIWDKTRSKKVWWGYLSRATLHIDDVRRKVDMRHMANRVSVAYTLNNTRETTTFTADTDSVNEFGKKEIRLSAGEMTDTQAQNYRGTMLAQRKYPSISVPLASSGGRNFAQVRCRGWWDTLSWQYYDNDAGKEEYMDLDSFPGRTVQKQGDGRPRLAQSFTNSSGSNWDVNKIYIRARKVEEGIGVSDALEVYLYDDSAGEPGSSQANASVTAANIDTFSDWIEFELNTTVTLTSGSTYWIVVQNETYPSVDKNDYFYIDGNSSEGYVNGRLLLYNVNSSSWEAWSQPCDINFRVVGEEVTTTQVSNIVSDAGEFLIGTNIIDASGLSTNPYREGDNTARFEIEKLLEYGTTNDLRLLARVLDNYKLEVYEEPEKFEDDYILGNDGVRDPEGNVVLPQDCPVGVWMRYRDAMPGHVNTNRLSNASHVFVEEAEYRVRDNRYHILQTRDISDFKDVFGVIDG